MPFDGKNMVALTEAGVASFNEVAGVYGIGTPSATQAGRYTILYVGQTDSFKRRLAEHFADKKHCIWQNKPTVVFAEVVTDARARTAREQALLTEFKPRCNDQMVARPPA